LVLLGEVLMGGFLLVRAGVPAEVMRRLSPLTSLTA